MAGCLRSLNSPSAIRYHHLLKTFWTGIGGWADQQLPDGTVIWTSPTGKTYKTLPGSRIFFPAWSTTTAELPPLPTPAPRVGTRGLMMPKRRRTRAADRARRICEERALNAAHIVELDDATQRSTPPTDPWDVDVESVIYDDLHRDGNRRFTRDFVT